MVDRDAKHSLIEAEVHLSERSEHDLGYLNIDYSHPPATEALSFLLGLL